MLYDFIRSITVEGMIAFILIGMIVGFLVIGGLLFIIFRIARRSKSKTQ